MARRRSHLRAACASLVAGAAMLASAQQPSATIDIGTILGVQTALPNAPAPVNKFLGVPFAAPPVRFMPPKPAAQLAAPLNTTEWKPSCIQDFAGPFFISWIPQAIFNVPTPKESEDCLYLNVYAPSTPPPPEGFPVMFWLYGGAFVSGTASLPFYDGSAFAAYQDVIVVTTNYRTNAFGFPNSPELGDAQQNAGLHDQHMALKWVADNIHAFGGSKDRVTIFGQSAGAWSVDSMLLVYGNDNPAPFQGAILESGQTVIKPTNQVADRTESWDKLVAELDCDTAASPLACVQNAPEKQVHDVVTQKALTFIPVVDELTWFGPQAIDSKRTSGDFAQVPILEGTLTQEGRAIALGQINLRGFLQGLFSAAPQLVDSAVQLFSAAVFGTSAYEQSSAAVTEVVFTCPQALHMAATAAHGIPVWGYQYNASFANTAFSSTSGVYHSSEINVVFETFPDGPVNPRPLLPWGLLHTGDPSTPDQLRLAQSLNKAWADFAKDPRAGPGWAAYNGSAAGVLWEIEQAPEDAHEIAWSQYALNCSDYKQLYCQYSPSAQVC